MPEFTGWEWLWLSVQTVWHIYRPWLLIGLGLVVFWLVLRHTG